MYAFTYELLVVAEFLRRVLVYEMESNAWSRLNRADRRDRPAQMHCAERQAVKELSLASRAVANPTSCCLA